MRHKEKPDIQREAPVELSPLDQIRQAEAEVARQIATASVAADTTISETNTQASQIKNQSIEAGRRNGLTIYNEIIEKSRLEAKEITLRGQEDAKQLLVQGGKLMDKAVETALRLVLSLEEGQDRNEH